MAIFNVLRAGRKQKGYMERLINGMYMDRRAFYRRGNGANDIHPQMIIDSFKAVRNTYYKMNLIEAHYLEIIFDEKLDRSVVCMIAQNFGKFLFLGGFQNFVTAINTGQTYVIAVAINSVSYVNGRTFWDNNSVCCEMYTHLRKIIPEGIELQISDNTLFSKNIGSDNYIHGIYC